MYKTYCESNATFWYIAVRETKRIFILMVFRCRLAFRRRHKACPVYKRGKDKTPLKNLTSKILKYRFYEVLVCIFVITIFPMLAHIEACSYRCHYLNRLCHLKWLAPNENITIMKDLYEFFITIISRNPF